jgi:hypothetical protein
VQHLLICTKASTKMPFHNQAMLKDLLTLNTEYPVTLFGNVPFGCDAQVFDPVIRSVPIQVCDPFSWLERSTEGGLHNDTVLQNKPPINGNPPVAKTVNMTVTSVSANPF